MDPFRFRRTTRPLIYGHRGAKAHVVENTMPSFQRALDDGADGVELDVRTTRDGDVLVMHDVDLERMTDGRDLRKVHELTTREVQAVELTGPGGAAFAPTLAEVLDWADATGCLVNVELKHDTADKGLLARGVARLLRGRARVASHVIFSSFEPELLARVALLLPQVPRGFLVHEGQKLAKTFVAPAIAKATGSIALHPERTLCSHERVAGWKKGLLVNVWTVNDPTEGRDLARLGVDGLITDDPATILAGLA
ncbi:MAG: glycerophosphodiester phosphodiesterase [Sandaracinaceae bacterium]|nr:glycerophosphodiester phosphodiesterase [Sandaracinaceae bacterium]